MIQRWLGEPLGEPAAAGLWLLLWLLPALGLGLAAGWMLAGRPAPRRLGSALTWTRHHLAGFLARAIDGVLSDGSLRLLAFTTEFVADLVRFTTTGNVRNYALFVYLGLVALAAWMLL